MPVWPPLLVYLVLSIGLVGKWVADPASAPIGPSIVLTVIVIWSLIVVIRDGRWKRAPQPVWAELDQDGLSFRQRYRLAWADVSEVRLVSRRSMRGVAAVPAQGFVFIAQEPVRLPWHRFVDRLVARRWGTPFVLNPTDELPLNELRTAIERLSGKPVRRMPPEDPLF